MQLDTTGPTCLPSLNRAIFEAQAKKSADRRIDDLRALVLEMGHVIRALDIDHQHLEFWTQDDNYVLDGRF